MGAPEAVLAERCLQPETSTIASEGVQMHSVFKAAVAAALFGAAALPVSQVAAHGDGGSSHRKLAEGMLFTSNRDGTNNIYLLFGDDRKIKQLTKNAGQNLRFRVQPGWPMDCLRLQSRRRLRGPADACRRLRPGRHHQQYGCRPASGLEPRWAPARIRLEPRWQLRRLHHEAERHRRAASDVHARGRVRSALQPQRQEDRLHQRHGR